MMGPAILAMAIVSPAQQQSAILDIAQPDVVAKALQEAGYKAELKVDPQGEPEIISAANGANFVVRFYGCTAAMACGSLQFFNYHKKEPYFDAAMANDWNSRKRFLKVAIDSDGDLSFFMDVSTVGGMTVENFRDTVDWFAVMDADLDKFVREQREIAKPSSTPAG